MNSSIFKLLQVAGALRRVGRAAKLRHAVFPAFAMLLMVAGTPGLAQSRTGRIVNVYNWSDYVDPTVLADFSKATGIEVRYDTFDSNDTLETKLLAGKSGYDVVVPTAYFLEREIKAGLFQKFDKSKLPHLGNVWPEIARRLATYDPGNQYAVNYMWGTTGIGYNVGKARAILGADPATAMSSWDTVFKPDSIARFKDCGVHLLDSSDDIMPAALNYLGLNPNSAEPAELEKAAELLISIRPYIRKFHSSEYLNALAGDEICLVVGWSGDIKQAQKRAAEAKSASASKAGVEIGYAIPKGGAMMWFDNFAIPKDAPHVAEAHAFIDYLLLPEVAARNSLYVSYASGNLAAQAVMDKSVLDDRSIYPDAETMASLYTITAHDQKTQRLMNRLWTRIKTGR